MNSDASTHFTMKNNSSSLRILSFNIRTAPCELGTPYAWPLRRDLCRDLIADGGYDFVGTQEAWFSSDNPDADQAGDLSRGLPAYGMLGTTRDQDPANGEGCPLFYRRDRWELDAENHGVSWLSDTPAVRDSRIEDASYSRILVWGRFHELDGGRRTGRTVLFANTHLDYLYEHTALLQAAICDRLLAEQARPGEPLFLTGDFNMYERSWPIRHLLGEALPAASAIPQAPLPLRDAWREAHPGDPDARTYHGWGGNPEDRRIDYVFFSGDLRVVDAQIDRAQRDGRFPSDHYPLSATFSILA